MGYLLLGIFINQSIWYKVDDKTIYGAWITMVGAAVTVAVNVMFVPAYGYMAAAWAHVACYLSMVAGSYLVGQKLYPIKYETGKICCIYCPGGDCCSSFRDCWTETIKF